MVYCLRKHSIKNGRTEMFLRRKTKTHEITVAADDFQKLQNNQPTGKISQETVGRLKMGARLHVVHLEDPECRIEAQVHRGAMTGPRLLPITQEEN